MPSPQVLINDIEVDIEIHSHTFYEESSKTTFAKPQSPKTAGTGTGQKQRPKSNKK